MNIVGALTKTFLFKEFPTPELDRLAHAATHEQRPAESLLFREGDPGDQLYCIIVGSVKVLKRDRDGVDEEVAMLGSGSYFGEMAVLQHEHKRGATIITREPTELVSFTYQHLNKVLSHDDKIAHHLYKALANGLARRLAATTTDAAFFKALAKRHA
jgi:CRP-like cAMP-binding protein